MCIQMYKIYKTYEDYLSHKQINYDKILKSFLMVRYKNLKFEDF